MEAAGGGYKDIVTHGMFNGTPRKPTWNLEPRNYPLQRESHLPTMDFQVPC